MLGSGQGWNHSSVQERRRIWRCVQREISSLSWGRIGGAPGLPFPLEPSAAVVGGVGWGGWGGARLQGVSKEDLILGSHK